MLLNITCDLISVHLTVLVLKGCSDHLYKLRVANDILRQNTHLMLLFIGSYRQVVAGWFMETYLICSLDSSLEASAVCSTVLELVSVQLVPE